MYKFKEWIFVLLMIFIRDGRTLGISSKLDFGGSSSSPGIRPTLSGPQYKLSKTPSDYRTITIEQTKPADDFDQIGVVCVSGTGCNTTESTNNNSDAEIKTDVHVHVHTKVDLKSKNKTILDDTPDVPVVVGLKGTNLDSSSTGIGSGLLSDSFLNTDQTYDIPEEFSAIGQIKPLNEFSGIVNLDPNEIFVPTSNIDSSTPILLTPNINAEPKLDLGFENAPILTGGVNTRNDFKNIKYKNEMEVNIPYFESAYHKHYYGEHPPQHLVWYPKRGGSYNNNNPVEFRNFVKPSWKPFVSDRNFNTNYNSNYNYNLRPSYHKHTDTSGIRTEVCTCKTHHPQSGSTTQTISRHLGNGDPGSQINDKLAPLN